MTQEQKQRILEAVKQISEASAEVLEIINEIESDIEQGVLFAAVEAIINSNQKLLNLVK